MFYDRRVEPVKLVCVRSQDGIRSMSDHDPLGSLPVQFPHRGVQIAAADGARAFRTTAGWDVVVTRAELVTGPLYFYEATPALARGVPWLGIRAAYAHPGHEGHGEARGELLEGRRVDLLAGAFLGQGQQEPPLT